MIPRKLTGNASVDAIATMAISGNVIPATWYKTITTASGKADLAAINILSDVLYWYRPSEIRDESTGDVIAYRKRFSADLLQRSYDQIAEHFGLSKRQAKDAVVRLEELGDVEPGTPMSEFRHRYGEIPTDIYKDYSETTRRSSSDHPTNQPENLSCDKGDGGLAETSESFERAWEKVPSSKASQCAKEKAWRVWQESLLGDDVDEEFLAGSYRRYVIQQEQAGTEARFIATLSTWLKPNRPITGLSLDTALENRRRQRTRAERQAAERRAEERRRMEEERIQALEIAWRDSDPEAQRLWSLAWDYGAGFDRMGDAMGEYRAYRDEKFKPG